MFGGASALEAFVGGWINRDQRRAARTFSRARNYRRPLLRLARTDRDDEAVDGLSPGPACVDLVWTGRCDGGAVTTTVLVPMEGSPLSRRALRHALETFPDASVTVLHVVDLFEAGYGTYPDVDTSYEPMIGSEEWYDRADEVSERLFADACDLAAEHDREVTTTSEIGDPKRVVVDYAAEEGIDHVVLGAHGRREGERPVFGSVAEIVARRATVPVTLVR